MPMNFEANNNNDEIKHAPQHAGDPVSTGVATSNSNSSSMAGAVVAGLSGLFLWKKSASNEAAENRQEPVGFQTPRFDPLDDMPENIDEANSILRERQEPVLGVPDYMSNDDQEYFEQNVSVSGLKDVITSKIVATSTARAGPFL